MPNPEIPQYRESVSVSPPGAVNTASGVRETPSYAQAGLSVADKFLNNELGNIMGDLGAKAGAAQGKDFKSLPELTPEMAKYNQAALPIASQAAMNGMQNDAEGYYRQLMANGLSPDSNMIFKAQMQASLTSFTDSVDPKMAPNLAKAGMQIGQSYLNRINQQTAEMQKNQGIFNYLHNQDQSSSSLGAAAFEAGADARADKPLTSGGKNVAQLYSNGINMANSSWATTNVSPVAKEQMLKNSAYSVMSNSYMGETSEITKKILADVQQHISPAVDFARLNALHDDVVANPQNKKFGLSSEQNQRIQYQIARAQRSLKTSLNLTLPSGSAMSVALSDRIWQHGKEITPSETSALLNTKNGNIYVQNVQANKQAYDYTQGLIQNGSPAQRAESVANIKQGFYKGMFLQGSTLSASAKKSAANTAATQLSNFNELLRNNPYEALSQQIPAEVQSNLYNQGSSADARKEYLNMQTSPVSILESIPSPGAIALVRENQGNIHKQAQSQHIDPQSMGAMTNAQAQQIVGIVTAAPIKDKMQYMANLHAVYGPYYSNILNSLVKNGMRRDTAVLVNGANSGINQNIVSETAQGIQLQVDNQDATTIKTNEDNKKAFIKNLSSLDTSYKSMLNLMPAAQADTYKKLMWDLYVKRQKDVSPETHVNDLAKAVMPFSKESTNNGGVLIPHVINSVGPKNTISQRNVLTQDKANIVSKMNTLAGSPDLKVLDTSFIRRNFPIQNPTDDRLRDYIKSNAIWVSKGGSAYLTIAGVPLQTKAGDLYGLYFNNIDQHK